MENDKPGPVKKKNTNRDVSQTARERKIERLELTKEEDLDSYPSEGLNKDDLHKEQAYSSATYHLLQSAIQEVLQ